MQIGDRTETLTLSALLRQSFDPKNILRLTIRTGDKKRECRPAQIEAGDFWLNPGDAVDIQQSTP